MDAVANLSSGSRACCDILNSLPTELLDKIFRYFCFHCDPDVYGLLDLAEALRDHVNLCQSALAALCRTSRVLRSIAQPHMYHYVYIFSRPEHLALGLFLRTLILRPDLALAVRRLEVGRVDGNLDSSSWHEHAGLFNATAAKLGIGFQFPAEAQQVESRPAVALTTTSNVVKERLPRWDEWYSHLLVLALKLVPQLRRLKLVRPEWLSDNSALLEASLTLPVLEHLSVAPWDLEPTARVTVGAVTTLASRLAPNLCSMRLHNVGQSDELSYGGLAAHLSLANVTSLELSMCELEQPTLARLIGACGKLQSFTFLFRKERVPVWEPSVVLEPLREHHAGTLRRLAFQGTTEVRVIREADTLAGLDRLESFSCQAGCFEGPRKARQDGGGTGLWDQQEQREMYLLRTLPRSIKNVLLNGNISRVRDDLLWLAKERRQGAYPHLDVVSLGFPYRIDDEKKAWKEVEEAFATIGVEVQTRREWPLMDWDVIPGKRCRI